MKKKNLKKLALLGLTSGLILNSQLPLFAVSESDKTKSSTTLPASDPNSQNLGYHLMTERELLNELNDEGIALYNTLDEQGKLLARQTASQRCQASNKCQGLNACKTADNECAGKGKCKGLGKCALSDKNLAVKLVANKMAAKRSSSLEQ